METVEVELYSNVVNSPVVRMPGRKYPGVVIQGDSLFGLLSLMNEVIRALESKDYSELSDLVQELKDLLHERVMIYEDTLRQHQMELPYQKRRKED